MSVTAQTLVDEFLSQWGFDVDQAEALKWLDRRHKKMVRRSRCNRRTISIGSTTAGVAEYAVDAIEIYQVLVGSVPYGRAPRRSENDYARGTLVWSPRDQGLFVATADASGVSKIGLVPPPDTTGDAITGFAAMPAADLDLTSVLLVAEDFHEVLQEGMAATGYARDAEQLGAADRCETRFDAGCEEYRREVKRRGRTGPAQIRVRGINA